MQSNVVVIPDIPRRSQLDGLTGLINEEGLKEQYNSYIEKYPESSFVMIDLKLFKTFNDQYGHNKGDRVLIIFAELLKAVFDDSLVCRLHGDEYSILTKYSERDIQLRLEAIDSQIKNYVGNARDDQIPQKFDFNAGSSHAEESLALTKDKADCMMYHAKYAKEGNGKVFQEYNENFWKKKQKEKAFISNVEENLKDNSLTYYERDILPKLGYDRKGNRVIPVIELTTRDSNGESIFKEENYDILRETCLLRDIDFSNIRYIFYRLAQEDQKNSFLVNIDYKSLLFEDDLLSTVKTLIRDTKVDPSRIILSVNINDIPSKQHKRIIDTANSLKKIGFKLCIDRYNGITPDAIFSNVDVDFVKIDSNYWKTSLDREKQRETLKLKLLLLSEVLGITPIFTYVENQNDISYILGELTANCISTIPCVSGDYIAREIHIQNDQEKKNK